MHGQKAEFNGINVVMSFDNFPLAKRYAQSINMMERANFSTKDYEFEICTDQRRLQQVLLNLLSNSLKFTKPGGSITIKVKYIRDWSDLTYQGEFAELQQEQRMAMLLEHGMIEVQVVDTGIGIKDEDQQKLFKLFGFIDSTKELNTSGIGLGLHISKQIVRQFGGDIICKSEWGVGTTFCFLIALDESQQLVKGIHRIRNPLHKKYIKIKLPTSDAEDDDLSLDQEQLRHDAPYQAQSLSAVPDKIYKSEYHDQKP